MGKLIERLRELAEWAEANEWETPIDLSDTLTEAANRLEQLNHTPIAWVSVKDRLPEESGTYLIVTNRGNVMSAYYAANFKKFNGNAGKSCTHWLPLPKPPKEVT